MLPRLPSLLPVSPLRRLLITAGAILAVVNAASPLSAARRGPELVRHWTAAASAVGSIHYDAIIEPRGDDTSSLTGRIGPGSLDAVLTLHNGQTLHLRYDDREIEKTDPMTGWRSREAVTANSPLPFLTRDPFGLEKPVSKPDFLYEDTDGTQIWDYKIAAGNNYRVWLRPTPLRLTRLEIRGPPGHVVETFEYFDHYGISAKLTLPRAFLVRNTNTTAFVRSSDVAVRPPIPALARLPAQLSSDIALGNLLNNDPVFREIVFRVDDLERRLRAKTGSVTTDQVSLLASKLKIELADYHKAFARHPLLELHAARLDAIALDYDLAARRIVRAAKKWPFPRYGITPLVSAAEIGAGIMEARGDSNLLFWAFEKSLPRIPDDLTDLQSDVLASVANIAAAAFDKVGKPGEALSLLERAFHMNPSSPVIRRDLTRRLIETNHETRAITIAFRHTAALDSGAAALMELAAILESVNRLDKTVHVLTEGNKRFPDEAEFPLRLARIHWQRKEWTAAQRLYAELLSSMDRSYMVPPARARIYHEIAARFVDAKIDLIQARRLMEYALAIEPGNPAYWDTFGMTQLLQGDRLDARASFEKALDLDPRVEYESHLRMTAP